MKSSSFVLIREIRGLFYTQHSTHSMKIIKTLAFLFLLFSPSLLPAQISIGVAGKKNAPKSAVPSELASVRKLSDFYFTKNNSEEHSLVIKSFSVEINTADGNKKFAESHTDHFAEDILQAIQTAQPKTKLIFTNIKATTTGKPGVELLPDLILKVKEE